MATPAHPPHAGPASMADPLGMDVQYVKGVGPRVGELLGKLGIRTLRDLLFHFPRRYEDRSNLPPIAHLRPGDYASVKGHIRGIETRSLRGGRVILQAHLRDGSGGIVLTWFNQPWIKRQLENHAGPVIAYGKVTENGYVYEIAAPEFELLTDEANPDEFARITPIYPLTEGLGQRTVRRAIKSALGYLDTIVEPLPVDLLKAERMKGLAWSLRNIHAPETEEKRLMARRRLVFEEFFYMQLRLAQQRAERAGQTGIAFPIESLRADLQSQMAQMLPFQLTGAQNRVIADIWADMARPHPMNRLLQGDVGSGKTAVAAVAMLACVQAGYQAVLMAPTEILAEQHARNLQALFAPLGISVDSLVGRHAKGRKTATKTKARSGMTPILVGTHALIEDNVQFDRLGLVAIDEQHRFGVLQRAALRQKGEIEPDVLVMTATPIPRTLSMTRYGDLDVSVIDELPPGRTPIVTYWKHPGDRDEVYESVKPFLDKGEQAYFVCPMIGDNEKVNAQAATDLHYRLSSGVFAEYRVGLLHGQMRGIDKDEVMRQFRDHELDILVSTTVIEVGVDVPNATVMVIEDANRFGLAQLHQLRGRVGRGGIQSYCVLIADEKSEDARERMKVLVETTDGFRIAQRDLELRGPGVIAGTQQSGEADFRIGDLMQDLQMLEHAREVAIRVVAENPGLTGPEWTAVRARITERASGPSVATIS